MVGLLKNTWPLLAIVLSSAWATEAVASSPHQGLRGITKNHERMMLQQSPEGAVPMDAADLNHLLEVALANAPAFDPAHIGDGEYTYEDGLTRESIEAAHPTDAPAFDHLLETALLKAPVFDPARIGEYTYEESPFEDQEDGKERRRLGWVVSQDLGGGNTANYHYSSSGGLVGISFFSGNRFIRFYSLMHRRMLRESPHGAAPMHGPIEDQEDDEERRRLGWVVSQDLGGGNTANYHYNSRGGLVGISFFSGGRFIRYYTLQKRRMLRESPEEAPSMDEAELTHHLETAPESLSDNRDHDEHRHLNYTVVKPYGSAGDVLHFHYRNNGMLIGMSCVNGGQVIWIRNMLH